MHINVGLNHPATQQKLTRCQSIMCSTLSRVQLSVTPWTISCPLSMGFFRQAHRSCLPFPPPGDLPDPGPEPVSLLFCIGRHIFHHWVSWEVPGRFFTTEPQRGPLFTKLHSLFLHKVLLETTKHNTKCTHLLHFCIQWWNKKLEKDDVLMINLPSLYFWKKNGKYN